MAEEGKDRGRIIVQRAAYAASLREIERDRIPERTPEQDSGEDKRDVPGGEEQKMIPPEFLCHPENGKDRQNEHGLQLEAKRRRGAEHGQGRLFIQRQIEREHEHSGIGAVTLGPNGAVEENGRQEKHREEAGEAHTVPSREAAEQHHRRPGEDDIEKGGEQLDEIQIPNGGQGEER